MASHLPLQILPVPIFPLTISKFLKQTTAMYKNNGSPISNERTVKNHSVFSAMPCFLRKCTVNAISLWHN